MARIHLQLTSRGAAVALAPLLALLLASCGAATKPPETGRPRGGGPPYPVVLTASDERRQGALAAWTAIAGTQGGPAPAPELRPVTATLAALPAGLPASLRLPKVVINEEEKLSEEEIRESLRRFISTAGPLLGVSTGDLSLVGVEEVAGAAGRMRALYRQTRFPHPLRNGYGDVEVTFTVPDLVVTGLSSTAVPDSERLRRALSAVTQQLTAQKAADSLANRAVVYQGRGGAQQTHTVAPAEQVAARQLVIFPVPSTADPARLELRLAWELSAGSTAAPLLVYVDAVTGEQLGAAEAPPAG